MSVFSSMKRSHVQMLTQNLWFCLMLLFKLFDVVDFEFSLINVTFFHVIFNNNYWDSNKTF